MKRFARLVVPALLCACSSKQAAAPAHSSSHGGSVNSPMPIGGHSSGLGDSGSDTADASLPSTTCPAGPFNSNPLPGGPLNTSLVCDGFTFTEGPVWFSNQNALFFSDFEQGNAASNFIGNVVRYPLASACRTFIEGNGSNGLAIAPDGNLLAAQHYSQTITEYDLSTKQSTDVINRYMGNHFSSPNDLTVHNNGTIYFSDPAYEVGYRTQTLPQAAYRRDPAGTLTMIDALDRPNGMTLSPDQTRLYISTTDAVLVYDVDDAGVPSNGRTFVATFSDGMTADCAGNLYLANGGGGGVLVYDPDGNQLGLINSPDTTNVAFGGPDRKTLFVTGGNQLRSIDLNIPGLPY
ncbi:MAG TPA: SMP-30/gluconolactonase/LRE family protein [Polyangiaceae bacterium]|nr:SMP-30/gluconolactonase/LRE family protein [Polyangiaceae bacterium]